MKDLELFCQKKCSLIGELTLKGKAEPVRAWEAIRPRPQPSREEALGALRAPMLGRDQELASLRDQLIDRFCVAAVLGPQRFDLRREAVALTNLGEAYNRLEQPDKALEPFTQSLSILRKQFLLNESRL